MRKTIRLPALFWEDHRDRDLPTPKPLENTESANVVIVAADDPALCDLLSDAEVYAGRHPADVPRAIVESAQRTVAAIRCKAA